MTRVRGELSLLALVGPRDAPEWRIARMAPTLQSEITRRFEVAWLELHDESTTVLVPFDPGDGLEAEELFYIEPFTLPDVLKAPLRHLDALPPLTEADIETDQVRALVGAEVVRGEPTLLLQATDTRFALKRAGFTLLYDRHRLVRLEHPGLTLSARVDAVLQGERLFFRSEQMVRRILDLTPYVREATAGEIEAFFSDPLFVVDGDVDRAELLDPVLRRRIARVLHGEVMKQHGAVEIAKVGRAYEAGLETEVVDGTPRLRLPRTKKGLRSLLTLLEDSFLHSELTGDRYRVSGKRRLPRRRGSSKEKRG